MQFSSGFLDNYIRQHFSKHSRLDIDMQLIKRGYRPKEIEIAWKTYFAEQKMEEELARLRFPKFSWIIAAIFSITGSILMAVGLFLPPYILESTIPNAGFPAFYILFLVSLTVLCNFVAYFLVIKPSLRPISYILLLVGFFPIGLIFLIENVYRDPLSLYLPANLLGLGLLAMLVANGFILMRMGLHRARIAQVYSKYG